MEPASKVSVPPTVVRRMRSRVPPKVVLVPPPAFMVALLVVPLVVEKTQLFEEIFVKTACPEVASAAVPTRASNRNPVDGDTLFVLLLHVCPVYPDVKAEPDPICSCGGLVPFVLTPFNITVIRFTQLGIPVKSMLVPLVVATAVPEVIRLAPIVGVPASV